MGTISVGPEGTVTTTNNWLTINWNVMNTRIFISGSGKYRRLRISGSQASSVEHLSVRRSCPDDLVLLCQRLFVLLLSRRRLPYNLRYVAPIFYLFIPLLSVLPLCLLILLSLKNRSFYVAKNNSVLVLWFYQFINNNICFVFVFIGYLKCNRKSVNQNISHRAVSTQRKEKKNREVEYNHNDLSVSIYF